MAERFCVIVGGQKYSFPTEAIAKYPKTRLAKLNRDPNFAPCYCLLSGTPYFERSAALFDTISNLYVNGRIYVPNTRCLLEFMVELEFWEVDLKYVDDVGREALKALQPKEPVRRRPGRCGEAKETVWTVLEYPTSSLLAKVIGSTSVFLILATVLLLILSSYRSFREPDPQSNSTVRVDVIETGETICVAYFTVEYFLRLWSSPDTRAFLTQPLGVVDLIAILPFYVERLFWLAGVGVSALDELKRSLPLVRMLRLLRVLRVLRILKVARYSTGLSSIGATLRRSGSELFMLVVFMVTAKSVLSVLVYHAECEERDTKFRSILDAMWWCVITMTTVGYGDIYPTTPIGQVLGGLTSIAGVILLAFPVSVIVENFRDEYQAQSDVETAVTPHDDSADCEPAKLDT